MLSSNHRRFIFALMLTFIVLTITGLTFYEYENGSVGETLEYEAFDADPKNWSATVDGADYDSSIWDGGTITVYLAYLYTRDLIDSIPIEFTFVVTVFNQAEESESITTTVRIIEDVTGPIIEQPANITYEEGSFGNEIQWNITESNPDFYNISRLSNEPGTNFTVLESGSWNDKEIVINVDDLNASRWYFYTLFVNDTSGRNASSSVNVTVLVDTTDPAISSPDDIAFEFGDTGFEVVWEAYDSNPKNYSIIGIIHYNDTLYGNFTEFHSFSNITQLSWTFAEPEGGDISILLDGLFLGNYTFNITAYDTFNQSTTDSVYVRIYPDIRAPIINASEDMEYEEGYTGYNITFNIEDNNPLFYNLTLDGTVMMNGTWRGENFTIDVDGLDVGIHDYNMTVGDFFGFNSSVIVHVEVTIDIHFPIIKEVQVLQSLTSQTTNNLTVQAYVWDINRITDITIEWGVGDPESDTFESETSSMTSSEITDFFAADIGEYSYGAVVWFRISATDNSSQQNTETIEWSNVTVTTQSYQGLPTIVYGIIGLLGGLSLLVFVVLYYKSRK